jgi:hypothetical protein
MVDAVGDVDTVDSASSSLAHAAIINAVTTTRERRDLLCRR